MKEKLHRSKTDRMISGVCGGLAVFLGWDSSLVRVGVVVLAIVTGFFPLGLVYAVMWFVVPEEGV